MWLSGKDMWLSGKDMWLSGREYGCLAGNMAVWQVCEVL